MRRHAHWKTHITHTPAIHHTSFHIPILNLWVLRNSSKRPYGVGLLVAGCDEKGPHLFETCPSGNYFEYYAMVWALDFTRKIRKCSVRWTVKYVDVRQVSLCLLRGQFVKVFQNPRFETHWWKWYFIGFPGFIQWTYSPTSILNYHRRWQISCFCRPLAVAPPLFLRQKSGGKVVKSICFLRVSSIQKDGTKTVV